MIQHTQAKTPSRLQRSCPYRSMRRAWGLQKKIGQSKPDSYLNYPQTGPNLAWTVPFFLQLPRHALCRQKNDTLENIRTLITFDQRPL